ncbi:hypothetical protein IFR05_011762 [Cadophora sp. M221]|nr:hypothetical protein IFR05_011762 [Cadophora sp. M221]
MATKMPTETYYIASEVPHNIDAGSWTPYPLSRHIFTLLDPVSPSPGIRQTLHLSQLLLLSNHLSQANSLLTALYNHGPSIIPPSPYEESKVDMYYSLEAFWLAHKGTHPRPANAPATYASKDQTLKERLAYERWGKFRECTFTGWMHEHWNLREPKDAHCWRESEDPRMLAICSRLLAKTKVRGEYVSESRMREALDAALKLYAIPPKKEEYDGSKEAKSQRYCSLLYKRLPIELAIRLGELDVAREILSEALRHDGFSNGGSLDEFLMIPGIWDVLPLLNEKEKEGNAYFITKGDADVLVKGIIEALELRVKEGRQWSLAPEKLSWTELLERMARGAWKVNRREYRGKGIASWRGVLNEPASEEEIEAAEKKFGELPKDFKDMCRVSDGFKGGYLFLAGGLAGIESMFFDDGESDLEHYAGDFYTREVDLSQETAHDMLQLISGQESEEFRHYIIPHRMWKDIVKGGDVEEGEYQYWHMTNWSVEASHWGSVWDWVASLVEEVECMVEKGEKIEHFDDRGHLIVDEESEDGESEMEGGDEATEINPEQDTGEQNEKRTVGDGSDDEWVKVDEMMK